jgi:hypothetical protein
MEEEPPEKSVAKKYPKLKSNNNQISELNGKCYKYFLSKNH